MSGAVCFLLLLQLFCAACGAWVEHSPYSLQAAVDELHRRESDKYPLNAPPTQNYFTGALDLGGEPDYWDDDSDLTSNTYNKNRNRHKLNKALAKYLEQERFQTNNDGLGLGPFGGYEFDEDSSNQFVVEPDEKKRSSYFRERDNKYESQPSSVFRERETQGASTGGITLPEQTELTEQFLREIEDAKEREREERYKGALRNLWEKYEHQENNINDDLFEEKKRMRIPPYYMLMQKKRSYPVLPWLPYAERKKRFPVAKRSTRHVSSQNISLGKTDDRVAKELSELFGSSASATSDEKRKRSTDEQTRTSSTHAPAITSTASNNMLLEMPAKRDNSTEATTKTATSIDVHDHRHQHGSDHVHSAHGQKEYKHRKRSDHHGSHESHEEEEEVSESEEHEDDEVDEEDDEEFEEEEAEESKKKRDLSKAKLINLELLRAENIPSARTSNQRQKKSIDWSKYFGIDRKKKALKKENAAGIEVKKRGASSTEASSNDEDMKKRNLDSEQLDIMDRKLQSIEDFIIDETIKYTGAHEGIADPDEIRRLKDHVLSRLATAYSLEKMRRALDKLRQSVEAENHLLRNVIEPEDNTENDLENTLSAKKVRTPLHEVENMGFPTGNDRTKEIHSNAMMSANSADANTKNAEPNEKNDRNLEQVKKHKKKRNGYMRYPELPNEFAGMQEDIVDAGRYEPLNDAYLGNKNYIIGSNRCPLIESMTERCRGIDVLSGDINQELLPICGIHQICYLCGTTQVACDYQYLTEADAICGNNNDCQAAARSILMILRGTPSPQLGPRECLKNSCLHSAMREIGL
ncbi:histone acetyltransferase KAT6B isoform X2 [Rhagoletis pomonella]|uniref:histone acetyltransferase KAT6B isoform X2 n=1 Tax=Rhagoletis pomonella TaxID=28610 RepID=UPI00177DFD22|nr:histone acetyltransferase KAT6B isoform X2 [Rhagoletis pomonella]